MDSLKAMAKENSIEKDFVDMYLAGDIPELCDVLTAALGKIDVEAAELKPKEIMEDWVEYLRGQCMESELVAYTVRKKGKSLKGCIAELLKLALRESADSGQGYHQGSRRYCGPGDARYSGNGPGEADYQGLLHGKVGERSEENRISENAAV